MIKIETINYFELLDYQRKKMIAELDTYSEKQLLFKPKKDGWSMAQVIDHLYLVEKQAKNYIDNKLLEQKENIPPTNWKSGFRKNILNIAVRALKGFESTEQLNLTLNQQLENVLKT